MSQSKHKLLVFVGISLLSVFAVNMTWHNPISLISLILILAYLKHSLAPIRSATLTFVVFGIAGTAMESLMMLAGPWDYATPHVLNFPIWLPFLWGLAGTLSITLYEGLRGLAY